MGKKAKVQRVISQKEKEVLKRNKELLYPTDRLGAGSAMIQQTHTNSSRLIMVNHQLGHALNIKDPEVPLVPSGFENLLAEFSALNEKADGDYRIAYKIVKHQYSYVLIGYDEKRKHWHAWERKEIEEHSEGFATRYKNSKTDELEVDDVVPEGTFIKKTESYDKYNNYCLGKNLNTVWLISTMVLEDGIALMNGADKKMNTYRCFTVSVPVNDNEIFLNLYGDKTVYKTFPKIGEKIKHGVLCAVRTIDNSKAPYSLKDKTLRDFEGSDRVYSITGKVIDINIRYNKDRSKLIEAKTNEQLNEAYISQQDYYMQLYKIMSEIVDRADDEGWTYSDEFSRICADALDYVDSSAFFSDYNENIYGNMIVDFVIMDEEKLIPGSKMVGRSGNKGVVSKILPPEKSWRMEDGTLIEVVMSALGIVGRLNPSQLNEHSCNELATTAIAKMKMYDDPDDKIKVVYDLLSYLNSDEKDSMKAWYKNLSRKEREKFCKKIETDGLIIVQDPVDNANIVDFEKAYDQFQPKYQRIVFPDGCRSVRKVLCSKLYFLRLKQDPKDKYSARGRGPVNVLHGMPSKSSRRKKFLDLFSDVPVRFGNYELDVLNANNEPEANADFMAENSTSTQAKDQISELYTQDPADALDIIIDNNTSKKNIDMLTAHITVLGSRLEFQYEGDEEDEDDDSIAISLDDVDVEEDEDDDSEEPAELDDFED